MVAVTVLILLQLKLVTYSKNYSENNTTKGQSQDCPFLTTKYKIQSHEYR